MERNGEEKAMTFRLQLLLIAITALQTMGWTSANAADKPLKVFILAGQSNIRDKPMHPHCQAYNK